MFGKKRTSLTSGYSEQLETIIGKETQIKGNITAGGSIRIDGRVEGEISLKGEIIVGETGEIKANLRAHSANIAGVVQGNIDIVEKLELAPTAKLYGDIKTGTLIIGEGAIYKGACEMRNEKETALSEKPKK